MDLWVSRAKRQVGCVVCTRTILVGSEVMVSQTKRTSYIGTRTRRLSSHFECWLGTAREWLRDHPYAPEVKAGPGAKPRYTESQAQDRKRMLVQMGRLTKKQRGYLDDGLFEVARGYADRVAAIRWNLNSM